MISQSTVKVKATLRETIAQKVEQFLAQGGQIEVVPIGHTKEEKIGFNNVPIDFKNEKQNKLSQRAKPEFKPVIDKKYVNLIERLYPLAIQNMPLESELMTPMQVMRRYGFDNIMQAAALTAHDLLPTLEGKRGARFWLGDDIRAMDAMIIQEYETMIK